MLYDLATLPLKMGARMADLVTGGDTVNFDSTHTVPGNDPRRWADELERNPAAMSPLSVGAHQDGRATVGRPFPGGPRIAIEITSRQDGRTRDGRSRTVLNIRYSGDFVGPGRLTITQKPGQGLEVRDEWLGVKNLSALPSRAAELGHPVLAAAGLGNIGRKAR